MVHINECSLEVCEVLERFLALYHLARLYMTGDRAMQRLIGLTRNRAVDAAESCPTTCSELVRCFLLGTAARATMKSTQFDLAAFVAVSPLRARHLRIDGGGAAHREIPAPLFDLSRLTTLESVDLDLACKRHVPVTLPPSVTRASLRNVADLECVKDLGKLPALHTFAIRFGPRERAARKEFPFHVKWPASLTTLEIDTADYSTAAYEHLPQSLRSLSISDYGDGIGIGQVDLADVTSTLPTLTSLCVVNMDACINGRLSSALCELRIGGELRIGHRRTAYEAVNNIPSSVTRFSFGGICHAQSGQELSPYDLDMAIRTILPRLSLPDVDDALQFVSMCAPGLSNMFPSFLDFVVDTVAKHDLGAKYVESLVLFRVLRQHRHAVSLARVAFLLDTGHSVEQVRCIIGERHTHDPNCDNAKSPYVPHSGYLPMVEHGFKNSFSLIYSKGITDPAWRSPAVVCNLKSIKVSPSCIVELDLLLQHATLPSLANIDIVADRRFMFERMVEVLHRNRGKIPALNTIRAHGVDLFVEIDRFKPETTRMLTEMGMFGSRMGPYLVRYVQNPPVWTL